MNPICLNNIIRNGLNWRLIMAKINKEQKLKILFLFLLSNITVYLLSSQESLPNSPPQNKLYRENYIEVLISGNLYIPPEEGKEVSLRSQDQQIDIPHAIFLSEYKANLPNFSEEVPAPQFIIYINKKFLNQNLVTKKFNIMPFGTHNLPKKIKRKQYEIHY